MIMIMKEKATVNKKRKKDKDYSILILIFLLLFGISAAIFSGIVERNRSKDNWNNGYCKCGGKLDFESVDKHYGYFSCEECANIIYIDKGYLHNIDILND
jgi:hypothetical protein